MRAGILGVTLTLALGMGNAIAADGAGPRNGATDPAAPILPLDTVLRRVADRNPELRMWELKAQARSAQAEGGGAWMPPEVGIGAADLPYGMSMAPGDPAMMVSVRQMIPGLGKAGSRTGYLESRARGERAGGAWMRASLLADAKSRYAAMAVADRRLAVLAEAESVMRYMLQVAEARFKNRQADLATVQEAKAKLEELGAMGVMERSARLEAASALRLLMADTTLKEFSADTSLVLRGYADQPPESVLVSARPDLEQAEAAIRSMELEREWMRRQARPDFGIQFDHMEMFDMGRRFSVMGMMTLPSAPWASGMVRSETKGMALDIRSMRSDLEARRLMALRMARETRLMLRAESDLARRYATGVVPAFRLALDASMAAYQEGSGDLFRVLDAWDRWVMARMTAVEHLGKASALEAEYERETGKL